jgi:predicted nucleotidyltransferase component of viral defense system
MSYRRILPLLRVFPSKGERRGQPRANLRFESFAHRLAETQMSSKLTLANPEFPVSTSIPVIHQYLLYVVLYVLSQRCKGLILTGGMALRLVYESERMTFDLDFKGPMTVLASQRQIRWLTKIIFPYGFELSLVDHSKNKFRRRLIFDYTYHGSSTVRNVLQVDIARNGSIVYDTQEYTLISPYPRIPDFRIRVLAPEYQLAEKICTLLCDPKPSHLYDIWILRSKDIRTSKDLLHQMLAPRKIALSQGDIQQALSEAQARWNDELTPNLHKAVDFSITEDAVRFLYSFLEWIEPTDDTS